MNTISKIPGRKEVFPIIVENGTAPNVKPVAASAGQVNVTVKDDMSKEGQAREREAAMARVSHMPSQIIINNPVADPALEVCFANLVLRPSPIFNTPEGWRTRGGVASHECYQDGELLSSSDAVAAIYIALVAMNAEAEAKPAAKGKGK